MFLGQSYFWIVNKVVTQIDIEETPLCCDKIGLCIPPSFLQGKGIVQKKLNNNIDLFTWTAHES